MTHDPVDTVIQAYLDHLEKGTPEPSLDHLGPDERQLAEDIINSLNAGRGINPYQSRPSYTTLTAGTGADDALEPPANVGLTLDAIRADVTRALDTVPVADGAAENDGIRSDAVARCGPHRIRIQFRDDLTTTYDLAQLDPQAAAGPVFGRFAETAIVVPVIGDAALSSVAIDVFDTEPFIGSPDGHTHPPRLTRPILPLYETLRRLVDEFATDHHDDDTPGASQTIALDEIISDECQNASTAVVVEGQKARTEAKKDTWGNFDAASLLATLVQDAAAGELTAGELEDRITASAAA